MNELPPEPRRPSAPRLRNRLPQPEIAEEADDTFEESPEETGGGDRLQKVLAAAGLGSRRHCEEYIVQGRVTIDGVTATELGVKVDPDVQKICVDGERIRVARKEYYLLNKPKGYLCTNSDPSGRLRVFDLLPPTNARLFSVGRLDENSEGLLIITNDGDLAHHLAHPRFQIERVYHVQVAGLPTPETLTELKKGFFFTEGKFRVRDVRKLQVQGQSTILEVVLTEGQNREVRRLFARAGHKVMMLRRVSFASVKLGTLMPGAYRSLTHKELKDLQSIGTTRTPRERVAKGKGGRPLTGATGRPLKGTAPRSRPPAGKPSGGRGFTAGKRPAKKTNRPR